jgi:hypothetical protein
MKNFKKQIIFFTVFFFVFFIFPKKTLALRYSLIAPSGTLNRGQTVTFTINLDTQGQTVTNAQVGMTYETQYLEYVNTIAGSAFPNLTTQPQSGGKLLFSATSAGFNGNSTFAQVNFKIIASAPGSTELCVLWQVSPTPSQPTPTPPPTGSSPTPTSPQATSIPQTGSVERTRNSLIVGGGLLTASLGMLITNYFFNNRRKKLSSQPDKHKNNN